MRQAVSCLAFDYASSSRTIDADGRLHVRNVNISKAAVNGYRGDEIPRWEVLGLDPHRTYQMLRDPDELAKAASTFNSLPLLSEHVPVNAQDHRPSLVVGATGSNTVFRDPYLSTELVIWASPAIMAIDSGAQRELSAAYRYEPVMIAGTYNGQRFDGRMTALAGNHVALVRTGRVGPDCVVGDSKPTTEQLLKQFPHWNRLRA